jgi:hypothetical protein
MGNLEPSGNLAQAQLLYAVLLYDRQRSPEAMFTQIARLACCSLHNDAESSPYMMRTIIITRACRRNPIGA